MSSLDDAGLGPGPRAAVDRALDVDPALAGELELIAGLMSEASRATFWTELARRLEGARRPAAAVLPALEAAARARRD